MRRETELELLRRFFKHREDRTTDAAAEPMRNPAALYTDHARFAREWDALFRGAPLVVGVSGDLPVVGSAAALEAAGAPLLLVRGEDGLVRCFLNACRHRGSRVAEGRGTPGRVFSCPYHAWTYDLEGNLLGQPLARGGFDGLAREGLGLHPVPVAERFGVIVARPGGTAPVDVEDHLAGLGDELAAVDLAGLRFFAERSGVWDMNWKQAIDTFTESYHVFALHRETIAGDFLSTPGVGIAHGPHAIGTAMRRSVTALLDKDESEWKIRDHGSIVVRIFPNVVLNMPMDGHIEFWEVTPEDGSPHRTRVSMRFYTPGEVTSDKARAFWQANFDLTVGVVFSEDFDQQAAIHRNLRSGLVPEVIFGRNEPGLIDFHRAVADAIGEVSG